MTAKARKTYRVKEIFGPTVQGEGTFAGTVVKFVRFTGCNKWSGLEKDRPKSICHFCDTDFRGGEAMTADEIIERLDSLGPCRRVVITGGEPTLQLDKAFLLALKKAKYKSHLETNGSRPLGELLDMVDHVTCSPKQPMAETKLESCDELKILFPPIHDAITVEGFEGYESRRKYLQPVWDGNYEANIRATLQKAYQYPQWRISLQTHKIIGVQ